MTAMADRLVRTLEVIQMYRIPTNVRQFESLRQIRELTKRVDEQFNVLVQNAQRAAIENREAAPERRRERRAREEVRVRLFPAPPVPGTNAIVPITSENELVKEGRNQRHCVGSYANAVWGGRRYYYRVLAPQRATAEIVLGWDGWQRGNVLLAENRRPSHATIGAVDVWLSRHKLGGNGYGPAIRL